MNYQLYFYVMNVTSEWLYEWYEWLCDWDLFQYFQPFDINVMYDWCEWVIEIYFSIILTIWLIV